MEVMVFVVGHLRTNCYFVMNEKTKEGFLVDPGDSADTILENIQETGCELRGILLTHGHFDHLMALPKIKRETGVPIYGSRAEAFLFENADNNLSAKWLPEKIAFRADHYLEDGEEFTICGMDCRMILTPGHTGGSCCYYFEKEKTLFSGDTLFFHTYGITSHPTGSLEQEAASIKEKLFTLPDDVSVFPGHGDSTNLGFEKTTNPILDLNY